VISHLFNHLVSLAILNRDHRDNVFPKNMIDAVSENMNNQPTFTTVRFCWLQVNQLPSLAWGLRQGNGETYKPSPLRWQ
jgi:hypothetical protein